MRKLYVVTEEQVGSAPFPKFAFVEMGDAMDWLTLNPSNEVVSYEIHEVEEITCVDWLG